MEGPASADGPPFHIGFLGLAANACTALHTDSRDRSHLCKESDSFPGLCYLIVTPITFSRLIQRPKTIRKVNVLF